MNFRFNDSNQLIQKPRWSIMLSAMMMILTTTLCDLILE